MRLFPLLLPLVVLTAAWAGCATPRSGEPPSTFDVEITPASQPYAFIGQPNVFIVRLTGDASDAPIRVQAAAPGASVLADAVVAKVGDVLEFPVVPDASQAHQNVTFQVVATRGAETQTAKVTFEAWDPMTPPLEHAAAVREAWVAWLAQEHPELDITPETYWEGAFVRPNILVVSYYVFYTPRWEMGVRWHVMIPPHDWTEVYLRERYHETQPSLQWKQDSFSADPWSAPRAVTPEPVWR